jgi:hypothetical protein
MKTRKDAPRVVELCEQRDSIKKTAGRVRTAEDLSAGRPGKEYWAAGRRYQEPATVEFVHLADELRELVKREGELQIAEIDMELTGLGVEPDEFEAAAPGDITEAAVRGTA